MSRTRLLIGGLLLVPAAAIFLAGKLRRTAEDHLQSARAFAGSRRPEELAAAVRLRVVDELDAAVREAEEARDHVRLREALLLRAQVLSRTGAGSLAVGDLRQILERIDPGDPSALLDLGVLYGTLALEERAIPILDQVLESDPENAVALFWSADAHRRRANHQIEKLRERLEPLLAPRQTREAAETADALGYLPEGDPRALRLARELEESILPPELVAGAIEAVGEARAARGVALDRYRRSFRLRPGDPALRSLEGLLLLAYRGGLEEETLAGLALVPSIPSAGRDLETVLAACLVGVHRTGPALSLRPLRRLFDETEEVRSKVFRPATSTTWTTIFERWVDGRDFRRLEGSTGTEDFRRWGLFDPSVALAGDYLRGVVLVLRGDLDSAVAPLRKTAARADRDRARAAGAGRLLGRVAFARGELPLVREAVDGLLVLDEKDADALALRGLAELRLGGEAGRAAETLQRAIEIDPSAGADLASAWEEAEEIVQRGFGRQPSALAARLLKDWRLVDPSYPSPSLFLLVARELETLGKPEAALRNAEEAVLRMGDFVPTARAFGLMQIRLGQPSQGGETLRSVLRAAPDDLEAMRACASVGPDAPKEAMLLFLDRAPLDEARAPLARLRLENGDPKGALDLLASSGPETALLRASALRALRRPEEAREVLEKLGPERTEPIALAREWLALAASTGSHGDAGSAAASYLLPTIPEAECTAAGQRLLSLGFPEQALRLLPAEGSPEVLRLRGISLLLRSDIAGARDALDRAHGMGSPLAEGDLALFALLTEESRLPSKETASAPHIGGAETRESPEARILRLADHAPGWEAFLLARTDGSRGDPSLTPLRSSALLRSGRATQAIEEIALALEREPGSLPLLEALARACAEESCDPLGRVRLPDLAGGESPASLARRDPLAAWAALRPGPQSGKPPLDAEDLLAVVEALPAGFRDQAADDVALHLLRARGEEGGGSLGALERLSNVGAVALLRALDEKGPDRRAALTAAVAGIRDGSLSPPPPRFLLEFVPPLLEEEAAVVGRLLSALRSLDPSDRELLRLYAAFLERIGERARAFGLLFRDAEIHGGLQARLAVARRIARRAPVPDEDPRSWVRSISFFEGSPTRVGADLRAEAAAGQGAVRAALESAAREDSDRGLEGWLADVEAGTADALRAQAALLDGRAEEAVTFAGRARAAARTPWALFLEACALAFAGRADEASSLLEAADDEISSAGGPLREALLDLLHGLPGP
jgi:tetratricopeptide (TPR) repeat protein